MRFIKKNIIGKNSRMYILWFAAILLITQLPFTTYAGTNIDFEMPFEMMSEFEMAAEPTATVEIVPANMPSGVTLRTIGPSTVFTGQTHFFITHVTTSYQALSGTIRWEVLGGASGTTISGPEPIHLNLTPGHVSIASAVLRVAPNESDPMLTVRTILQIGEEISVLDKLVFVRPGAPRPPVVRPVVPPVPRPPPPPPPPPPPTPRPPARPLSPFAPLSPPGRLAPVPLPEQAPVADAVEAPTMLYFQPLSVNLNGRLFNFADQEAVLVRGTSFIPVGPLFTHLNYSVTWDNDTAMARLTRRNSEIIISEGERRFTVNGVNHMLPVAPMRVNDRLMVPFVALFESIGATSHRDANGIIHIYITR